MKLIIVSGPWSSGTTAVAGALAHLGYTGFGPYLQIRDERAANSYEFLPFRDLVLSLASEDNIRLTVASAEPIHAALAAFRQQILDQEFGAYDPASSPPIFLKFPLAALLLPWLPDHFELLQILVARPVAEIERTRLRRNWHAHHGVAGARVLYPVIFTATVEKAIPTQIVHYSQLLEKPEAVIRSMAQFCGYASSEEQVTAATQFIDNSAASRALNG